MRILDRYVLFSFLKNYLISTFVLVGFYVLLDMIFGIDNFTGFAGQISVWRIMFGIVEYYFYESFFTYAQLAGVIPVLAAAFTFMRMSRFNELTALLAAGVPLLRVSLPVILAAVAINLILQPINQELLIPSFAEKITRKQGDVFVEASTARPVRSMPDGSGGIFDAAQYHPAQGSNPPWVESLTVVERDPVAARVAEAAAQVGPPVAVGVAEGDDAPPDPPAGRDEDVPVPRHGEVTGRADVPRHHQGAKPVGKHEAAVVRVALRGGGPAGRPGDLAALGDRVRCRASGGEGGEEQGERGQAAHRAISGAGVVES